MVIYPELPGADEWQRGFTGRGGGQILYNSLKVFGDK